MAFPRPSAAFKRRMYIARFLAKRPATEADLSGVEISSALACLRAKPFTGWAHGDLVWLERHGLVTRTGIAGSRGQCWRITDAGLVWAKEA